MVCCQICLKENFNLVFEKDGTNFFKCKDCGIVFVWPLPIFEEAKEIYDKYGNEYYLEENKINYDFSASFDLRLSQIETYRNNNRLLDIGCSTGSFLVAARQKKWIGYGVELSSPAASYAQKKENLNVFCGTLEQAQFQDGYFDVINAWGVLEHVVNPLDIVRLSHRLLRKGGAFVFAVPHFNSFPVKIIGKKHRYISHDHLFNFSKKSIDVMLKRTNFRLLKMESSYFSPVAFIEDLRGVKPDTLRTHQQERRMLTQARSRKGLIFLAKPFWKVFKLFISKFYLGEDLSVIAVK